MKWGAHEVDGKLAAKNAVKIRAAIIASIDAEAIYRAYLDTHPEPSKNRAIDRTKARSWAMLHVVFDNEALFNALKRVWAEGYLLGSDSAHEAVYKAKELRKAAEDDYVDWQHWKPGNRITALLVRPSGALKDILDNANITIKDIDNTGYDRIGTALADSLSLGLSASRSAKLINDTIANPARSLTIAITETSRAMNLATKDTYQQLGLEKMEWSAADPCNLCAPNDGQIVNIGQAFNTGAEMPPVHPNCRCALLPVIPDYETNENGVVDIAPNSPAGQTYYGQIPHDKLEKTFELSRTDSALVNRGNINLAAAYDAAGYNGLPTVLSAEKYEQMLHDTGAWTKYYVTDKDVLMPNAVRVYRGVGGASRQGSTLAKEYLTGDHWAGFGVFGNGTYATPNWYTAMDYAKNGKGAGAVMDMLIPDTSNFIEYGNLNKLQKEVQKDLSAALNNPALSEQEREKLSKMFSMTNDHGLVATLMGYDGIYVKEQNYYVVLNRAKVVVKKELEVVK